MSAIGGTVAKKATRLLKLSEACAILSISMRTLNRLIHEKRIAVVDMAAGLNQRRRCLRITEEEIARFLEANSSHPPANSNNTN